MFYEPSSTEIGLLGVWSSSQLSPDVCIHSKPPSDHEDSAFIENNTRAHWSGPWYDFWTSSCQVIQKRNVWLL